MPATHAPKRHDPIEWRTRRMTGGVAALHAEPTTNGRIRIGGPGIRLYVDADVALDLCNQIADAIENPQPTCATPDSETR